MKLKELDVEQSFYLQDEMYTVRSQCDDATIANAGKNGYRYTIPNWLDVEPTTQRAPWGKIPDGALFRAPSDRLMMRCGDQRWCFDRGCFIDAPSRRDVPGFELVEFFDADFERVTETVWEEADEVQVGDEVRLVPDGKTYETKETFPSSIKIEWGGVYYTTPRETPFYKEVERVVRGTGEGMFVTSKNVLFVRNKPGSVWRLDRVPPRGGILRDEHDCARIVSLEVEPCH